MLTSDLQLLTQLNVSESECYCPDFTMCAQVSHNTVSQYPSDRYIDTNIVCVVTFNCSTPHNNHNMVMSTALQGIAATLVQG